MSDKKQFKCLRCDYEWNPRKKGKTPKVCPRCKSYEWNKPRVRPARNKKGGDKCSNGTLSDIL